MEFRSLKRAVRGIIGIAAMLHVGASNAVGTWETTLVGRDINGNAVAASSAVFLYDTTLNVTWLRNANVSGAMFWDSANSWANGLVVGVYGGWRLPTMIDTGSPGCDFSTAGGTDCGYNVMTKSGDPTKYEAGQTVYSEMAHLFYVTLGNKAYCPPGDQTCAGGPQPGYGLTNMGDFQNFQSNVYWLGLSNASRPDFEAWFMATSTGAQVTDLKDVPHFAMAVRPGDVSAVPEPTTYALILAGLGVVAVATRRR